MSVEQPDLDDELEKDRDHNEPGDNQDDEIPEVPNDTVPD